MQCSRFEDEGREDGIRRLLFGQNLKHWLLRLCLIDGLRYASEHLVLPSRERFVQVDVDGELR